MNLRDNPDGTCNCRPLGGGSCFFTDGFDNACNCKCHIKQELCDCSNVTHVKQESCSQPWEEMKEVITNEIDCDCGYALNFNEDAIKETFERILFTEKMKATEEERKIHNMLRNNEIKDLITKIQECKVSLRDKSDYLPNTYHFLKGKNEAYDTIISILRG